MTAHYTSQSSPSALKRGDCFDLRQFISAFDLLTKETYSQLGSAGQTAFFVGDGLQRAVLEGAFDLLSPQTWTPANMVRMGLFAARQAGRISELVTSPETARLAWQELQNKIEIFFLVKNLSSL